ncbi:MAG: hypothetical protein HXX13_02610 [Bacteroidetes bacterium]|nr:hypothetical protein [Bacteroidota bacterium]
MKNKDIALLIIGLLLFTSSAIAQFDPKSVCRFENGDLVFRIDKNWTDAQKHEVSIKFDLDSTLLVRIFDGFPLVSSDSITWKVKVLKPGLVEISKLTVPEVPAVNIPDLHIGTTPTMILHDLMISENYGGWTSVPAENVIYGVNSFSTASVFRYENSIASIYLPGFKDAINIFIAGSFNNWSTMQSPMIKLDSGWVFKVKLQPGRYMYKFIIDGKWEPDPNNKLKEDDTYGSHNSIFFCPNYIFKLSGYNEARNIILSGSFNNWNERELKMNRTQTGWELPLYLKEGTHAYKFKVDKQWILDPANKVTRPDGYGNQNSFMAIGDTLIFRLNGYKGARTVNLAGSFNAWNSGELFMQKDSMGWTIPYVLAKGNYEYKFVVDGKWMTDPANPYSTGGGETQNSFLAFKPNHTFQLDTLTQAHSVILTGSFNGWSNENYRMKLENGKWVFPIWLNPGKHTYKFIVDGTWILDPRNELWEENEYNTRNSLLWIEP